MEIIKKKKRKDPHPYIPELKDQFLKGKITRREFLWNSTMLGLSAAAAYAFISPFSAKKAMAAAMPQRGGTYTCAMNLQLIDHPARLSWTEGANVVRQVAEYLSDTGPDGITRPMLCEKWTASEDLKTWDLYLRKGVKFNNGQIMTADDVIWTMKQWLNKDVGSSMLGLLSYWGGPQNIEKVNDYHVRLHLEAGNIGVPEHLWHYPGPILPKTFEGDFIKQPIGTGAFTLEEYSEGERCVLKARKDYWRKGADGKPLPYLDRIIYIALDKDAAVAALQAGQVDSINHPRPSDYLAMKDNPNVNITSVASSYSYITRMRVDLPPWNDNRVRTALKMCQDRAKCLQLAGYGLGALAIDAHMSPAHPAYCKKPIPPYDPKGARKLMEAYAKEKGLKLPIKVRLATKNDEAEPEVAQTLKQTALAGGFDIQLDITEPGGYWDRWTEVDLGITAWTHRSIAVMVLPLAYTKEAIGAWNETRWHDDEFRSLLDKAQKTLDVEKRRTIMCDMEDIMQERGPIAINYWVKIFDISSKKMHNVKVHPTAFHSYMYELWKES
jgi:peptide/nickel transport system substrate-binding protein